MEKAMLFDEATVTTTEQAVAAAAQKALLSHRLRYEALLVLNAMIWGSTFLMVKNAIAISGPFTYLACCYAGERLP